MHPLQNGSQVTNKPDVKTTTGTPGYFSEGTPGQPPSYPGQDWFNSCIAEFLQLMTDAEIDFDTSKYTHLSEAVQTMAASAASGKADSDHSHSAGEVGAYTKAEVDEIASSKAAIGHGHTAAEVGAYTKSEVNTMLNDKANSDHSHSAGDVGAYTKGEVDELLAEKKSIHVINMNIRANTGEILHKHYTSDNDPVLSITESSLGIIIEIKEEFEILGFTGCPSSEQGISTNFGFMSIDYYGGEVGNKLNTHNRDNDGDPETFISNNVTIFYVAKSHQGVCDNTVLTKKLEKPC